MLIPARTLVRVQKVSGSVDWDYGGAVTSNVWFELSDGRTFILTTAASHGEIAYQYDLEAGRPSRGIWGLDWREIACAAMVVPVEHAVATDQAECEALLARIERGARGAVRGS